MTLSREPSRFGQLVRGWRKARGMSQLRLAQAAATTTRHVSFLETGRSRPRQDLVLRIATALNLQIRDTNSLLLSAGLSPAYPEKSLDEPSMDPFAGAIRKMLDQHDPYPGCAYDALAVPRMTNRSFRALFPNAESLTPEESIDRFYNPNRQSRFENWAEVAWAYADRWRLEASRTSNEAVGALAARVDAHMTRVPRPGPGSTDSAMVSPRFRVDGQTITTFSTVLRFDTAREVTLSELRIELVFPANQESAAFFRGLDLDAPASPRVDAT